MDRHSFESSKKHAKTPSGTIAYAESGSGPVALFIHGVLVNSYLWRHQLESLATHHRCIAIDLLGHGLSSAVVGQDVSFEAQAEMLAQFLDSLDIDKVDLVANDSGVGIASIFAARYPERLNTLTLTNGDVHDNWPPKEFSGFLEMVAAGGLPATLDRMLTDKDFFRSADAFGPAYESPKKVTDDVIEAYIRPITDSPERTNDLVRFILAFDNKQTVAIEEQLRTLNVPTLVVWGTGDIFFDKKWAYWLTENIPGALKPVEFAGACLLLPEERPEELNALLKKHWANQ